jgi:hypothetical protein
MARKTIRVPDKSGQEIPEGNMRRSESRSRTHEKECASSISPTPKPRRSVVAQLLDEGEGQRAAPDDQRRHYEHCCCLFVPTAVAPTARALPPWREIAIPSAPFRSRTRWAGIRFDPPLPGGPPPNRSGFLLTVALKAAPQVNLERNRRRSPRSE